MIFKFYKSYQPGALFLLPFIVFAMWYFGGIEAQKIDHHPLHFLDISLQWVNSNKVLTSVFGTIITMVGALIINQLFNRHHFIDRDIYLPALFFGVGFSSIPGNLHVSANHLAIICILLAIVQLMRTRRAEDAKNNVFNAGLLIGTATIFQPGVFPFILMPWLTLIIVRPFKWREILLPIIGAIFPLLYFITYFLAYFNFDALIRFYSWGHQVSISTFYSTSGEFVITSAIVFALIIVVALFSLISAASRSGLRFKKIVRFTISLLFVAGIVALFDLFGGYNVGGILIFVIPLSFILPHFIARIKNQRLAGFIFYTGFLMVILNFLFIHYL